MPSTQMLQASQAFSFCSPSLSVARTYSRAAGSSIKVSNDVVEEFVSCDAEGELGDEVADGDGESGEAVCMKF